MFNCDEWSLTANDIQRGEIGVLTTRKPTGKHSFTTQYDIDIADPCSKQDACQM